MARQHHKHDAITRYLLKQLSDAEQQEIELRLLSDESFGAEVEIAEDELIDEYLANKLSPDDRTRFEQDFLTNPERNNKLRSAQALKRYFNRMALETPAGPSRFWSKWSLFPSLVSIRGLSSTAVVAIGVLVVALSGPVIWRVAFYKSDLQKGLLALNEAYRHERPIEARISALDYAPFVRTRGNEPAQVDALELDRAQRYLLDAEKEQANAASAHALGKLYLSKKDYDKAIEYLEKAAKSDPKNAKLFADLGAAYFEKGRLELSLGANTGKGLEDLGRSLEYLKQSLEIDPNLLEALFNRGLVHQEQGLYQAAEADWRAYLEKDASSQWAVDARQNLKSLEDRKNRKSQQSGHALENFMRAYNDSDDTAAWDTYRRSHAAIGNDVTEGLVGQILAAHGPDELNKNLQVLDYLGQLEARNAKDLYTSDLARVYTLAMPQTLELLAQARQQVKKGQEAFSQLNFDEATGLFADAQKTFDRVEDLPESLAAGVTIAHAAAVQPDLVKGREVLARVVPACERRNYKWLLAQSLTHSAHIQSNLNNYSEAISDANRALQIFQEVKALSGTLNSHTQLASLHLFLNDNASSFSFLERGFAIAQQEAASPGQLWGVHIAISLNLSALHLYRAALDYQHEALQIALPSGNPLYISRSYQYIGLTYGAMRQFDLAFANINQAYDQGRPLAIKRKGQNVMANASLRLGDLYRLSGDDTRALTAYEESSRLYEGLGFAHYNYAAHKGKFLSYLAQHNDALAAQELLAVLNLFEESRGKILEERQNSAFFAKEQDIYDLAIDFTYFRLGDQRRAFDYSEISRARNLRELMTRGAKVTPGAAGLDLRASQQLETERTLPLTLAEIQQQIPEQVEIVQYVVLEKKVLVWCITRSDVFSSVIEIESSKLDEAVSKALNQIRLREDGGAAESLKVLYSLLLEPIRPQLNPGKVLCFIPDKTLHYLPFGALLSTSSGRYLVQDFRLMISPSANVLIESTKKAEARASAREEQLLAVGNPTFDRSANPNLANLASAEQEVEELAMSYPSRHVLIGTQATSKSVTGQLTRSDVTHFAAHFQIDPRSQLSSRVLLAPEPGEHAHAQVAGLTSGDIYQMTLPRTRLVVLSACETGIEQQLRGEGPIGFARSFLVAGVPVVVASLWPVDSEATAELMILFHRYRRSGHMSTTEALTRAQQEIRSSEKYHHPYYWAGFITIGGYSTF